LKATLYVVMLRNKPAIELLFDTYEDAKRYIDNIDRRRTRHRDAIIQPLTYYFPTKNVEALKKVHRAMKSVIGEMDTLQRDVNNLIGRLI
jgi:hypothetical protein